VDIDVFVSAHRPEWTRLETLVRRATRPRRLSGAQVDELVDLYQRAATHLSLVQTRSPDVVLIARLSRLVAAARAAIVGTHTPTWRRVARLFLVSFPAVVYRNRRWWLSVALTSAVVALLLGIWVDTHPGVQRALLPSQDVRDLVNRDFADYYHAHPAHDFALQVWTNNAWVSAEVLIGGLSFGVLTIAALLQNVINVGVIGGYMAAAGRTSIFFGLIAPHGILELTAVFVASGCGLRIGWTLVDPGPRTRSQALGEEVRAAVVVAMGLILVLAVSGAIEAFVTPSSLPTWARIGTGVLAEAAFLGFVFVAGARAAGAGETGDLDPALRGDVAPVAG
jgi:uncharacterized membrane protein SpoIIM required for sporulation